MSPTWSRSGLGPWLPKEPIFVGAAKVAPPVVLVVTSNSLVPVTEYAATSVYPVELATMAALAELTVLEPETDSTTVPMALPVKLSLTNRTEVEVLVSSSTSVGLTESARTLPVTALPKAAHEAPSDADEYTCVVPELVAATKTVDPSEVAASAVTGPERLAIRMGVLQLNGSVGHVSPQLFRKMPFAKEGLYSPDSNQMAEPFTSVEALTIPNIDCVLDSENTCTPEVFVAEVR